MLMFPHSFIFFSFHFWVYCISSAESGNKIYFYIIIRYGIVLFLMPVVHGKFFLNIFYYMYNMRGSRTAQTLEQLLFITV